MPAVNPFGSSSALFCAFVPLATPLPAGLGLAAGEAAAAASVSSSVARAGALRT